MSADAARDRMRARRHGATQRREPIDGHLVAPIPPDQHGTRHGYDNCGCRCMSCIDAHRRYHADRRKRMYAARVLVNGDLVAPVARELHGKGSTYNNAGCRCPSCCRAHAAAAAVTRQRRRTAS